ncbi:MAG: hypothetical protein KGQ58_03890 [Proteobacteria bacterium]|nr:hypothetical protein [Pseudomonadota bacterium]
MQINQSDIIELSHQHNIEIYIEFDPCVAGLAIALIYKPVNETTYMGYCILNNGEYHRLFLLNVDEDFEPLSLFSTDSANPWEGFTQNLLNIQPDIDIPVDMEANLAEEYEKMVYYLMQEWLFKSDSNRESMAIQYGILGYELFPINVYPWRFREMHYREERELSWFEYDSRKSDVVYHILEEYI